VTFEIVCEARVKNVSLYFCTGQQNYSSPRAPISNVTDDPEAEWKMCGVYIHCKSGTYSDINSLGRP
jgi:hypothetical protein